MKVRLKTKFRSLKQIAILKLFLILEITGIAAVRFFESVGQFVLFQKYFIISIYRREFFFSKLISEFLKLSIGSILIVGLTAFFAGAVLTLQLHEAFVKIGIVDQIPIVVFTTMAKDLGPILSGLMIVARVGSSTASEVSYMRTTNQIDVLKSLSVNHFRFLLLPKLLSMAAGAMLLFFTSTSFGIMGSYFISIKLLSFTSAQYSSILISAIHSSDLKIGLIKMEIFSCMTIFSSYYFGYISSEGANGVRESTLRSVIFGSVMVLFLNLLIVLIYQ